ncbi:LysR family transcriptional regulator [Nocardia sp. NBC_01503]|uniref:LysR family transcriptional regulator n=1 Tax=Nocardia sp. NBC_01503 TaxID=2975997 RepID=UPI002E7C2251|nr:LysR family transcriptional regulator [Nocardia sp. NBC_01503]WTL30982.1 LysR family transcriptional regulator [Nocardia sp. NBC_01503]
MTLPPGTPDLDVLDLLVSVAEFASLGAAARHHGITQPAASMRISALERRLRLRLLDRGPTGSQLTDAGRAVVAHALPVLAAARSFVEGVTALHTADVARLRVAASKTIADHRIPQWLAALRTTCPDVTVALEVENTRQVEVLVRDGAADLGFVEGPHSPRGLDSRVIGADELVVVVSPAHVWANRRKTVTLRELACTALLWREPGSGTRETVWEVLSAECQPAAPAAELGSAIAITAAACNGVAPAVLSRLIAAPMLSTGALVEVRLAIPVALTRKFRVIWRRQSPPSGPAEFLVRHALRVDSTSPSNW